MHYGMFYMHRCDQKSVLDSRTQSPAYQTAHSDACITYHTAQKTVCLRINPTRFETLNINLLNCAFRRFVLYDYIIMHGAINAKYKHLVTTCFGWIRLSSGKCRISGKSKKG